MTTTMWLHAESFCLFIYLFSIYIPSFANYSIKLNSYCWYLRNVNTYSNIISLVYSFIFKRYICTLIELSLVMMQILIKMTSQIRMYQYTTYVCNINRWQSKFVIVSYNYNSQWCHHTMYLIYCSDKWWFQWPTSGS